MLTGINHINLSVRNLETSFLFYRDLLGLKPLCKWPNGAYFLAGDFWFCLNSAPERNPSPASDYTHFAFSVAQQDFEALRARLIDAGVAPFKENFSEGDSFYFHDPDGYKLEIHVGDWKSRIAAKKLAPWPGVEFYPI